MEALSTPSFGGVHAGYQGGKSFAKARSSSEEQRLGQSRPLDDDATTTTHHEGKTNDGCHTVSRGTSAQEEEVMLVESGVPLREAAAG